MNYYYILKNKTPILCNSLQEWSEFNSQNDRQVALTTIGNSAVSTIFLGLNHNINEDEPPILFETMILGEKFDGCIIRYSTWEEAEKGHQLIVESVKKSNLDNKEIIENE